eukprot:Gb_35557 [translate_table: standard]
MMSSNLNLIMTVIGFAMSIMFIIFVCTRLLCVRLHLRGLRGAPERTVERDFATLERGINGMEPVVVATFPTIKYDHQVFASTEDDLCAVCLGEYQEKDMLRVLPNCGHAFHINCIDLWLRQQSTCPVCRLSLRYSCDGKRIQSPLLSMAALSRYSPGAISESLFEHSCMSLNRSSGLQSTVSIHSRGQPTLPFSFEADRNGSGPHDFDRTNLERCSYTVQEDNCGGQDLCSGQFNDAGNSGPQFVSQVFVKNDEKSRRHCLRPQKALEEGQKVSGNSLEVQCGQGSVFVQIDNSKAMGITSGSQVQHSLNVESPDHSFERSSFVNGLQMDLMASGVIENAVFSSVSSRHKEDGVVSMDASGRSDSFHRKSIPILIEGARNILDESSSCTSTHEDSSVTIDGSSLKCRDCEDTHRSLEHNFKLPSAEFEVGISTSNIA